MSSLRFILRSLTHHWRINLAVALGVLAATAVLTGALLVGDSMRGSLRSLALDRLGRIDEALIADRFFRSELASELSGSKAFKENYDLAAPVILFPRGAVERPGGKSTRRAAGVLVVGCDETFWQLAREAARPHKIPGPGQIVLNEPLAGELGITRSELGDRPVKVTLRIPRLKQVSGESPLGRKTDETRALPELEVVDVIPAESLGRFSLHPSQSLPRCAYVGTSTLQEALDQEGKVNAIFVAGRVGSESLSERQDTERRRALAASLRPTLSDYGFSLKQVRRTFRPNDDAPEEVIYDYFSFSTERMMLDRAAETTAEQAFAADHAQGVLTYLANSIAKVDSTNAIAYSTISAVDSAPGIGPLLDAQGVPILLADDEIALTSWAAEDLSVEPGEEIAVTYFEPERTHGDTQERTQRFKLKTIVPLTEPERPYERRKPALFKQRPTLANDPDLTPEVPGVTDQETISKWDPPFPYDSTRIRPVDNEYWDNHRTTPKAYVSLAAGQRLWGSRFGQLTSLRIPARTGLTQEMLDQKFRDQAARDGSALGLAFRPIRRESIRASSGATPFDALFLSLSFFIIAAALLLVSLLFRLGIEQRASELGTLLAVGLRRGQVARLFVSEGAAVAALGGLLGVLGGVAYAWLMLAGLRTIWLGAVVTPFLQLHTTSQSLAIGYVSGVVVSALTIALSILRSRKTSVRALLSGKATEDLPAGSNLRGAPRRGGHGLIWIAVALLLVCSSIGLAALATQLGGEAQAGAFMGSGAAMLATILLFISLRLNAAAQGRGTAGGFALLGLASRNAARNPGRSTLTIGLIAAASFLIVAVSAFRLDPTDAGTGGFNLVAESNLPVYDDFNSPVGRKELLADRAAVLDGGLIFPLRLQAGDDASCNNLYQAARPRVLGITPQLVAHFDEAKVQGFAWAGSAAQSPAERKNPWRLLDSPETAASGTVPVVLDKNTAMYSLKLYRGIGEEFSVAYDDGPPIKFRVAGLLANSILQGSLLIGEEDFKRHFPQVSGYRYFLIQPPPDSDAAVAQALEDKLSDQGFDSTDARLLLTELLAVQNTYLSTFQALGGLGLLLGTIGLAAVQVRSVLERRGELALLRAAGFRRWRLAEMVLLENVVLLLCGLASGVFAALVAVLPHAIVGGARVPFAMLAAVLAVVLVSGILSGLWAIRATLRAPLLAALRGE